MQIFIMLLTDFNINPPMIFLQILHSNVLVLPIVKVILCILLIEAGINNGDKKISCFCNEKYKNKSKPNFSKYKH